MVGQTYGIVSHSLDTSLDPLSAPVILLITHLDETGKLLGFLQWPEPVIRDSGAKFYMMRVCPSHRIGNDLLIYTITV